MTKNADTNKYFYSGYGISFDTRRKFSLSDDRVFGKNAIIFDIDNSSSTHFDNRNKYILNLGKGPTKVLDDNTLTAEDEYSISFSEQDKKKCLSLLCNGASFFC